MSDTEKVVDDENVAVANEKSEKREMTEEEKLQKTREVAEKLPKLSLVTPAHNCKKTFFILLGNFIPSRTII